MDDEEIECEPEELLGKPFHFLIIVDKGMIPPHYKQTHIEYNFKVNEFAKECFKSNIVRF